MAPFALFVIPFAIGIAISSCFTVPAAYPFFASLALTALAVVFSAKKIFSHAALYLALFFLGFLCLQNARALPACHVAGFASDEARTVILGGRVLNDPSISDLFGGGKRAGFVLGAEMISEPGRTPRDVSGPVKVDAYCDYPAHPEYGDRVILKGRLSRPAGLKNPGLFDYAEYLNIRNIYAVMKVGPQDPIRVISANTSSCSARKLSYRIRRAIRRVIDDYLNPPYSDFLKAILIGDRSGLNARIKEDFVKTGTVHLLAISGLHVGLIAGVIIALIALLRVPRRINLLLTLASLILYSFIAGSSPPVIRAVIMFGLFTAGYIIRRDSDMMNSLAIAAFLILAWNPKELFDPGFQLSFVSVAAIVVLTPKIRGLLGADRFRPTSAKNKAMRYVLQATAVSIAAWIGTFPLVAEYFNIVSPVCIAANLIAVPILFLIIALSFVFIPLAMISGFMGAICAESIRHASDILFFANRMLSAIPFSHFRVPAPPAPLIILYYALILFWAKARRRRKAVLLAALVLLNVAVWGSVVSGGAERVEITFLDVGSGDCAFIRLPGGETILIDGGSGGEAGGFDMGRQVAAPFLWNRGISKIDMVISTHPHEDHIGGLLYILENFKIGCVIDNGSAPKDNKAYDEFMGAVRRKNIRRVTVMEGERINFGCGAKIFVLNPPSRENEKKFSGENEGSLVMKFVYKKSSVLFGGDVMGEAIARLNSYGEFLKSDVLKVPHHGGLLGEESSVKSFFKNISPAISIVSVGRSNRYHAPSDRTIEIITDLKSKSYETKKDGAVTIFIGPEGVKLGKRKWYKN